MAPREQVLKAIGAAVGDMYGVEVDYTVVGEYEWEWLEFTHDDIVWQVCIFEKKSQLPDAPS
jgi:hypothetical protein